MFGPAGGDVDGIGGKGVGSFESGAAVSYGIGFKESWPEFVPLPCLDRDVVFEKESGFCGAPSFAPIEMFDGLEKPVDGRRRDFEKFLDDIEWERAVIELVGSDPIGDSGFETLGTDEIGADPDSFEGFP